MAVQGFWEVAAATSHKASQTTKYHQHAYIEYIVGEMEGAFTYDKKTERSQVGRNASHEPITLLDMSSPVT